MRPGLLYSLQDGLLLVWLSPPCPQGCRRQGMRQQKAAGGAWGSMEAAGGAWGSMEAAGGAWGSMEAAGGAWGSMEADGKPC